MYAMNETAVILLAQCAHPADAARELTMARILSAHAFAGGILALMLVALTAKCYPFPFHTWIPVELREEAAK
jgi:NADH:ubiquinone oxidoreductase subunit 4 (subunit M)